MGFNPFKSVSKIFSGGAGLFKSLFKSASGILSGIGSFLKPQFPEIKIPEPPAAPALTENMPAADKEKSAAAEAERRRALAKYGKRTRTLLTSPMGLETAGMAKKRLLGE